jgi:RNA recognition motif-containing protein
MNIYVGNLSFKTTDQDLEQAFASFGEVQSARVALERDTQRSRGFGFVEMPNQSDANAAIAALNGSDLQGRTLTVNEARPAGDRPSRGNYSNQSSYGQSRSRY